MRYSATHKEQARKKMLTLTAAKAKQDGFSSTGIDSLAKAAGVTSGAVYSQFGSKDGLFAQMVDSELSRSQAFFMNKSREEVLEGLKWYLSLSHVTKPGDGCVMPALSAEIGRAGDEIRQIYERKLTEICEAGSALTGDNALSWALIAQAIGAVVISRAMYSDNARLDLLNSVLEVSERILNESAAK
ncbi:TetR/AcrR family transcriptional regulator [Aeromonas caviae]|uniref:TetR/AcrR family transcriptional regulator n=1 Tax=Aeromonas caviae TaxID=648 RepID=UPI002B495EC3|nr:TetR/AcrR family transcriptional regulator [Aeromonas caviae]